MVDVTESENSDSVVECEKCKHVIPPLDPKAPVWDDKAFLCKDCLDSWAAEASKCPNCGEIATENEEVGLVLTPKGSSEIEKATAIDVLCVVCPNCRILYFDELNYSLIRGLKRNK